MQVFLPDKVDGLESIEKAFLSGEARIGKISQCMVNLALPKFKTRTTLDMMDLLPSLGISDIFVASRADLSGISAVKPLFVGLFAQSAHIEVNEWGTIGAAGTVLGVYKSGGSEKDFRVDRPFFYRILEYRTGLTLFVGRVVDPTNGAKRAPSPKR